MRRKFDNAVNLIKPGINMNAKALDGAQINLAYSGVLRLLSPDSRRQFSIWQFIDSIYNHKRFAINTNVTAILKRRKQTPYEVTIIFGGVLLGYQNFVLEAIPTTCPVLISPAEAKREIWMTAAQHFIERAFQKTSPAEPVVIVTETMYPILARQLSLPLTRFGDTQIVKAEVGGQMRLVMAFKIGTTLSHIGPFRKTLPPPLIVFLDGVKLRQIEGYCANVIASQASQRLTTLLQEGFNQIMAFRVSDGFQTVSTY